MISQRPTGCSNYFSTCNTRYLGAPISVIATAITISTFVLAYLNYIPSTVAYSIGAVDLIVIISLAFRALYSRHTTSQRESRQIPLYRGALTEEDMDKLKNNINEDFQDPLPWVLDIRKHHPDARRSLNNIHLALDSIYKDENFIKNPVEYIEEKLDTQKKEDFSSEVQAFVLRRALAKIRR